MKQFFNIFSSATFAGALIGIAAYGYLCNPMLGMFLFVVGLAGVVMYRAKLYTGYVGFIYGWQDFWGLLPVIAGNLLGTALVSCLACYCEPSLSSAATTIATLRLSHGAVHCGFMAIGCGVLMSMAVDGARRSTNFGDWVPLCVAVPAFILCGFPHSIADSMYYMTVTKDFFAEHHNDILLTWLACVLGNGAGCNLYRVLLR